MRLSEERETFFFFLLVRKLDGEPRRGR